MKNILSALVIAAAVSATNVVAQAIYIPQLDPVAMHLQQQLFQQMAFGELYRDSTVGSNPTRGRTAKGPTTKSVGTLTTFNPTGGRILPERLSGVAGKNAVAANNGSKVFDVFLNNYEKTARNDGFPPNDPTSPISARAVEIGCQPALPCAEYERQLLSRAA